MDNDTISADSTGFFPPAIGEATLFEDRLDAATRLTARLREQAAADTVVVALSHGGAVVAAEVRVIPRSGYCSIQAIVAAPSCTSPILWVRPV